MQIDKKYLSEVNYTGSRLIEINDPKVEELKAKLREFQLEANPILKRTEPFLKEIEPLKEERRALKAKCTQLLTEMQPLRDQYDEETLKLPKNFKGSNKKLDLIARKIKVFIDKIHAHEKKMEKINKKIRPWSDKYEAEMKKVEAIDQQASIYKQKLVPLVNKLVEKDLTEFEEAKHVIEKDGKIYVEVFDQLEEFIKTYRQKKLK